MPIWWRTTDGCGFKRRLVETLVSQAAFECDLRRRQHDDHCRAFQHPVFGGVLAPEQRLYEQQRDLFRLQVQVARDRLQRLGKAKTKKAKP